MNKMNSPTQEIFELKEINERTAHILRCWNLIEPNIRGLEEESLGFSAHQKPSREQIVEYDFKFGISSDYYIIKLRNEQYCIDFYKDTIRSEGFESIRKQWISGEAFEEWYKLNSILGKNNLNKHLKMLKGGKRK